MSVEKFPLSNSNIGFDLLWPPYVIPLKLLTIGIFYLLGSSLKHLFVNTAFQIEAKIIPIVEFVVAVQEMLPFYSCTNPLACHWWEWALDSTGLGVGSPAELASFLSLKRQHHLQGQVWGW